MVIWDTTCLQKMQAGCLSKWNTPWIRNLPSLGLKRGAQSSQGFAWMPLHPFLRSPEAVPCARPRGGLGGKPSLALAPPCSASIWRKQNVAQGACGSRIKWGILKLLLMCSHWHQLLRTIKPTEATRLPPSSGGCRCWLSEAGDAAGKARPRGKRKVFYSTSKFTF